MEAGEAARVDSPDQSAAPSRAFGCAALLGIVALLPGLGYVLVSVMDTLAHRGSPTWARDVALLLAMGALGPGAVAAAAARMMWRPDRPVGVFVVALVLTSVPTLLFAGLATFGPDGGGIVIACMLAVISGASAALVAIVAAIRRRRARPGGA